MNELQMEIRRVALAEGVLEGICAPYDETTFLAGDGRGERILRGAFRKSAHEQAGRLKLFRNHEHGRPVGIATRITDRHPDGLWASFKLADGDRYRDVRDELEQGLLSDLSVGFRTVQERRGDDGAREITEAQLVEVSLVPIGAYSGARVLAMRGISGTFDYPHAPPPPPIPAWLLETR